ncbi:MULTISPECIES: response regulator transcription factor [unclassified Streptomyces]|uniref:response regulator transcription factor n=1 Tax=unclassified Streptomyces TaxID=2593676 RepID=UPI0024418C46|nr:response regulator transcription factor [Streptomyces sp. DH41]MDG9722022.1 response regulator transcription factor [Streptomyces sp. DH41]
MSGGTAAGPLRVVVADDQELVRAGFAMILDAQPDIEVVAEAADGAEAIAAVRDHAPDVALLDIRMPGTDGLTATAEICATTATRVIILTTFDLDAYVFEALRAGASGFLLKDVRRDDLAHAVRVVAGGDSLLSPSVTSKLIAHCTSAPAAVPLLPDPRLDSLTTRETETLRLLARGLTNPEIAATMVISEHTVKTHVSSVLAKLGLRDRIQAVITAYEAGLAVPGRRDPVNSVATASSSGSVGATSAVSLRRAPRGAEG